MMNDAQIGGRVSAETKEKWDNLADSLQEAGVIRNKGDIFDYLLSVSEKSDLEKNVQFGSDLRFVREETEKIVNFFASFLHKYNDSLERNKEEAQADLVKLQKQYEDLREIKESKDQEILELKMQIEDKTLEVKERDNIIADLTKEKGQLEKDKEELHDRINEQKSSIAANLETIKKLVQEKETMTEEIKENDALRGEIESLEKEKSELVRSNHDELREKEYEHRQTILDFREKFMTEYNDKLQTALSEQRYKFEEKHDNERRELERQIEALKRHLSENTNND